MTNTEFRFDVARAGSKEAIAVYAIRGRGNKGTFTEYMASVYPVLTVGALTARRFEFAIFRLHPEQSVDFEKNLFDQPMLIPMLPAMVNCQMEEKTLETAMTKARMLVDYLSLWAWGFPGQLPHPSSLTQRAA